jgi:hypothetical protein
MRNKITVNKLLMIAILAIATVPDNARAWRGGYYHGGPRVGISFNYGYPPAYGGYAYPYYYHPNYYPPYPVYYAAPPVVYARPVVVETAPVYVRESQQIDNQPEDERYCREYTDNVRVGGHAGSSYGTACQQPDGSWEIQ